MATLDADDLQAISDLIDERVEATLAALIVEGANQADGDGEVAAVDVTLLQAVRTIYAYCANNATGLEGPQAIIKSRHGGRNRIVATLANGNRTVTSRDGS